MEENKVTETPSVDINYKEELERANRELAEKSEELKKAQYTLKKKNIEEKKSKIFSDDIEPAHEAPEQDLDSIIRSRVQEEVKMLRAEDVFRKHSSNEDEIALAKFHLENSIKSSGNLETDAINALALANAKKLQKYNTEMAAAIAAKAQTVSVSQGSSSKDKTPEQFSTDLTPEQLAKLRSEGMSDRAIARFIELRKKQGN